METLSKTYNKSNTHQHG